MQTKNGIGSNNFDCRNFQSQHVSGESERLPRRTRSFAVDGAAAAFSDGVEEVLVDLAGHP